MSRCSPHGADRGQTIVEYVGVLAFVAAIIAVLAGTALPEMVGGAFQSAVCRILGGDDCGQPVADGEPSQDADSDHPQAGPAIGRGGEIVALPFPGRVTVSCSLGREQGEDCRGRPGTNRAVEAVFTGSAGRSEPTLSVSTDPRTGDEELRREVSLGVTTELVITGKASGEAHDVTVSASASAGERTGYQITVTEQEADAIADGEMAPPNPLDPTSIPQFDGVLMTEDHFLRAGLSAQYRAIQADLQFEEGQRAASGVTRLGEDAQGRDLVLLNVGDEEYVRNRMSLGFQLGDAVTLTPLAVTTEHAGVRGRTATVDISTPEGWQTYQDFVRTGELPQTGGPGVVDTTTVEGYRSSHNNTAEAKVKTRLGELGISLPGSSSDFNVTTETSADGSQREVHSYRIDDVTMVVETAVDPDGEVTDTNYSLMLEGVSPATLGTYENPQELHRTGENAQVTWSRGRRVGFSEALVLAA